MKIILGPLQTKFLRDLLDHEIWTQEQFRFEQTGSGGPSNPKTIKANILYADRQIKGCKDLLKKLKESK